MARLDGDGNANGRKKTTSGSGEISPYRRATDGNICSWGDVDFTVLNQCVDAVTRNGDAVLFSRSYDGGVLVLTVCAGSERIKFYAREGLEMTGHLQGIISGLAVRSGRS